MSGARSDAISTALAKISVPARADRGSATFLAADTRMLLPMLPDCSVDCVITSPPYAELKDYGPKGQLGFGQGSHDEYLSDLGNILRELHRVAKSGSAMWVVLDTVKSSGRTLLLPWEAIHRAQEAGWNFEDLVVWDKGRSLPWSHIGRFRGVFEYVLLFCKGRLRHFAVDSVREIDHLSPYWVRYPERYNPSGKFPTDLWHFPIPVQGSWSRNGIRHYCPFPVSMVARMMALTTKPGQVVLDPFAGTGTVLATASYLHRRAVGIDLNTRFVRDFDSKGYDALVKVAQTELGDQPDKHTRSDLAPLIIRLRALKSPRTLFTELSRPDRLGNKARKTIAAFFLTRGSNWRARSDARSLGQVSISVLARRGVSIAEIRRYIDIVLTVPPLSKFGLTYNVEVIAERHWRDGRFFAPILGKRWFVYTSGKFHAYNRSASRVELPTLVTLLAETDQSPFPPIVSTLKSDVNSPPAD